MAETLLFTKALDRSVSKYAIVIPYEYQKKFFAILGFSLERGQKREISIELERKVYDRFIVRNVDFDSKKFRDHTTDIVRVEYRRGYHKEFLARMGDIFASESFPEKQRGYIAIFVDSGKLRLECIPREEKLPTMREILMRERVIPQYVRDKSLVAKAREEAHGVCQLCEKIAPFRDKEGHPFLEVHHIIWLSRGGLDDLSNLIALCPNCHTKMHIVDDKKDVESLIGKKRDMRV